MQEKTRHQTKRGPGRMPKSRNKHNPPGTKLIKRFIKDAGGEASVYRRDLQAIDPGHRLAGGDRS